MAKSETMNEAWQETSNRVAEYAGEAKEKAAEMGRNAEQKVNQKREAAANALQSTAGSLRDRAQSSGEAISNFGNKTADKLQHTAEYLRDHDMRGMMGDLEGVVRRNPGPSLIAAAAFGFLLGAAMRGRD
jgi:vacuolar-type H+-ATPase subunit E/Vma4